MRKQLLGLVLPLLMMVGVAAAADIENTGAVATTHAALERLNVVRGDDGISLEITARGVVAPTLTTLRSPARVVIDLVASPLQTDFPASGRRGIAKRGQHASAFEGPGDAETEELHQRTAQVDLRDQRL